MGRGAQAQTQQMIDQQLSQQNSMNQQLYGLSQALGSQASSGYQNLLANPGYTPRGTIGDHQSLAVCAVLLL